MIHTNNKSSIAFIATSKSITAVIQGQTYTVMSDNTAFNEVKEGLKKRLSEEEMIGLFNAGKAVTKFTRGRVTLDEGHLYLDGEVLPHVLFERIVGFMKEGLPHEPLINFLNRLAANPSRRAIRELYTWLEHKKLPITDDGFILGYKSVRSDWTDHHTGTVNNHIGQRPVMPRNHVDDNKEVGCSDGYHVGSLEYAESFGGSDKHLLIVKVDPADVVSIPTDRNCQKMRTCRYEVVQEYVAPLPDVYAGRGVATTSAVSHN